MQRHYVTSSPPPSESFRKLEAESLKRVYRTLQIDGVEYDVVWDGGEGLTTHEGGSNLKAAVASLAVGTLE
jgi:hypothetical protein